MESSTKGVCWKELSLTNLIFEMFFWLKAVDVWIHDFDDAKE